jgi:hypothetical protein
MEPSAISTNSLGDVGVALGDAQPEPGYEINEKNEKGWRPVMSYLERAKQVVAEAGYVLTRPRCSECRELEGRGVTVLHCAACGYEAPAEQRPQPRPGDLVYPLAYVRVQAPGLHEPYLGRFWHWTRRFREAGWSQEDAERAAFRRVLLSPQAVRSADRTTQLGLAAVGMGVGDG